MTNPPLIFYLSLPGLAIGLAAGLSETEGTAKTAIMAFAGLIGSGGVIAWTKLSEVAVMGISMLSMGFILGILLGAITRMKIGISIKWI